MGFHIPVTYIYAILYGLCLLLYRIVMSIFCKRERRSNGSEMRDEMLPDFDSEAVRIVPRERYRNLTVSNHSDLLMYVCAFITMLTGISRSYANSTDKRSALCISILLSIEVVLALTIIILKILHKKTHKKWENYLLRKCLSRAVLILNIIYTVYVIALLFFIEHNIISLFGGNSTYVKNFYKQYVRPFNLTKIT